VLRAQGLDRDEPFAAASAEAAAALAVEQLGYVQIDTISVVERAHHHVLWSRIPAYSPALLPRLTAPLQGPLFEYWAHAASYLCWRDYRHCLPRMRFYAAGKRHWFDRPSKRLRELVLGRIRDEGPLLARDFEEERGKKGGWWEWKPAKITLERLCTEGVLMVRERRGIEKVFDLAERVIPPWVDTSEPSPAEHARWLLHQALRAQALVTPGEVHYLRKVPGRALLSKVVAQEEESGAIVRVRVEGMQEECFALASLEGSLAAPASPGPARARILSPFDPLVINRKRLSRLFGFEYQVECYLPEHKRRHGYFVLPVLLGERFAARADCKAERERGVLVVKALHLERPRERKAVLEALRPELQRFAAFNGCAEVELPREALARLGLAGRGPRSSALRTRRAR
jgi:uncharacterized protein